MSGKQIEAYPIPKAFYAAFEDVGVDHPLYWDEELGIYFRNKCQGVATFIPPQDGATGVEPPEYQLTRACAFDNVMFVVDAAHDVLVALLEKRESIPDDLWPLLDELNESLRHMTDPASFKEHAEENGWIRSAKDRDLLDAQARAVSR